MSIEEYDSTYCYPGTKVFKNLLDIRNPEELRHAERISTSARLFELKVNPIEGNFNLDHLKEIHRFMFQDLYEWAGELRAIRIAKGNMMFAYPENIENQANIYFKELGKEGFLKNLPMEQFCNRLAYYKTEINLLHPFREGNGRAIRELIESLAKHNGYELDFSVINREQYMEAMIKSPYDTRLLEGLMKEAISDTRTDNKTLTLREVILDLNKVPGTLNLPYENLDKKVDFFSLEPSSKPFNHVLIYKLEHSHINHSLPLLDVDISHNKHDFMKNLLVKDQSAQNLLKELLNGILTPEKSLER